MKRTTMSMLVIALAAMGLAVGAQSAEPVTAKVSSNATVISNVNVVFDFYLSHCPAGQELVLVDWEATQPSRSDSGAATAGQDFGLSNGDDTQQLTAFTGSSSFLAGEHWTGSGHIACGATVIAVSGSGDTHSVNH